MRGGLGRSSRSAGEDDMEDRGRIVRQEGRIAGERGEDVGRAKSAALVAGGAELLVAEPPLVP